MNQPLPAFLKTKEEAVGAAFMVSGMHRSGTSAITRVLSLLGAELPRTLMKPGADNPRGFWESEEIAKVNDALLSQFGSSWDDVLAILARRQQLARDPAVLDRVRAVVEAEYTCSGDIVVKDPRIALLLDVWISALGSKRLSPRVIIPLRDPLEVAASLGRRNALSTGNALLLWLAYFLAAERSSRAVPRAFVNYADFLTDWRGVMRHVETALDVSFARWSPSLELEVDAFVSASDRHEVLPNDLINQRPDVVDWVKRAYAWARAAAAGLSPPTAEIDAVAAEFEASLRTFSPLIAEQRRMIAGLRDDLRAAVRERTHAEEARAAHAQVLERRIGEVERELAALKAEAGASAASAAAQRQEDEARIAFLERDLLAARAAHAQAEAAGAAHVQVLETRIGELDRDIEARNAQAEEAGAAHAHVLETRIGELERDLEARTTQVETLTQSAAAQQLERDARIALLETEAEEAKAKLAALSDDGAAKAAALESDRAHEALVASLEGEALETEKHVVAVTAAHAAHVAILESSLAEASQKLEESITGHAAHAAALESRVGEVEHQLADAMQGHALHVSQLETRVNELEIELGRRDTQLHDQLQLAEAKAKERQARVDALVRDMQALSEALREQTEEAEQQLATAVAAGEAALRELDETWRQRSAAALEQAEQAAIRRAAELDERHRAEMEQTALRHTAALSALREQHGVETEQARLHHMSGLAALHEQQRADQQALAARHAAELEQLQRRGADALAQAARDRQAQVRDFEQRLAAAVGDLESEAAARADLAAAIDTVRNAAAQSLEETVAEHGAAVLAASRALREARQKEYGENRAQFAQLPRARKRAAAFFRPEALRPLLRSSWVSRAATLLSSGLYVPVDGPGGHGIVAYAQGAPRAPSPHPLFDDAFYRRRNADVADREPLGALHYLWHGDAEARDPHPLFSVAWYRARYRQELSDWKLTTLEHYLLHGARNWLAPHPLFDTIYYAPQAPDVYQRGVNPLVHYLGSGGREGLDPHPLFRSAWYLEKHPDVRDAGMNPLEHYVLAGWRENRDPHPLFSTRGYLEANPDVRKAGVNPLIHYLTTGWRENRRPCANFDPQQYLHDNPDVASAGIEPLTHYLINGAWEGRKGAESFDVQRYCARYPYDVLRGVAPLEAWARAGSPELVAEGQPRASTASAGFSFGAQAADAALFEHFTGNGQELQDNYDWEAYERLSTAMHAEERARIQGLRPKPLQLIKLDEAKLGAAAAALSFKTEASEPDVSIVIPVYNQVKYTLECLTSLAATIGGVRAEVIVIDDGSTDQTQTLISAIAGVRYVRNEENLGFLRTVNRAAALARGRKLIILNNDTQVLGDWLRNLLAALDDESVGVAAPKLLFPDGRLQEAGAALRNNGSAELIGLFDDPKLDRFCYDRDVDYVSGACIALRRAEFEALGGFDMRYAPAYCEDSDLCMQMRAKGKRIRYVANAEVCHHLSVTSNALPGTYKIQQARRNQQKLLDRWDEAIEALNRVRVISFYLPQFHTIPENDQWWGAGFTEWRNVTRAAPNFVGHYQPHRPSELGFYDVMRAEVMERQADLARAHGVHGFCYYYYWFTGRRILEAPLDRLLQTGKPDLPFCICWANENWTRTWDGQEKDVLLEQRYSDSDDEAVIADMMRYFRLGNYIRINGKPLLVIYRPGLFPDFKRTAERWRRACRIAGIGEIYIAMVETFEHALTYPSPRAWGCDATIEFPPAGMSEPMNVSKRLNPRYTGTVCDYHRVVRRYLREPLPGHTRFRAAMPSWDNTARRQDTSYVFQGATPGAFQAWLEGVIEQTRLQNFGDERIVFVNAWNEWAEGAHLEPDLRFGRGWLEAVRNAQAASDLLDRGGQG
ncbi:glycoside hydrolase family 99-like domain-containing protein [Terricaulis sp.]|uniref:glycoside hydrolase family 99-like domain-containing protein n=1 Tax=Terricaulis sp. TaxID=2768686 RepID=UPI00378402D8